MKIHKKILLIGMPFWEVSNPTCSIAYVSSLIKNAGWYCKVVDLNIKIFKKVSEQDQAYWYISNPIINKEKKLLNPSDLYYKYHEQIENILLELYDSDSFDLVAFTVSQATRLFTVKATNFLKHARPEVKILYGGIDCFAMEYNNKFFNDGTEVDIICQGEAEISLPEFLKDLEEKGSIYTGVQGFAYRQNNKIVDTGNTIFPDFNNNIILSDWSQFDFTDYTRPDSLPIFTSRGCINRCKFCSECLNFKKFRYKKAEHIFKEIIHGLEYIKELSERPYIHLCDSLVNGNIQELEKLCDLIIESGIKVSFGGQAYFRPEMTYSLLEKISKAGCTSLCWGFESANQKVLDLMGKDFKLEVANEIIKNCYALGIGNVLPVIFGFPGETPSDVVDTIGYIFKNKIFAIFLTPQTVLVRPNSHLHSKYEKYNLANNNYLNWHTIDNKNNLETRKFRCFVGNNALNNHNLSFDTVLSLNDIISFDFNDFSLASEIAAIIYELGYRCQSEKDVELLFLNNDTENKDLIDPEEIKTWHPDNIPENLNLEKWFSRDKNSEDQKIMIINFILNLLKKYKNLVLKDCDYYYDILNNDTVKENISRFIRECKNKKVCFYGAGLFARAFVNNYDLSDLNVLGFIDNDPDKKGKNLNNYPIYNIEDLFVLNPDILALSVLDSNFLMSNIEEMMYTNNFKGTSKNSK